METEGKNAEGKILLKAYKAFSSLRKQPAPFCYTEVLKGEQATLLPPTIHLLCLRCI